MKDHREKVCAVWIHFCVVPEQEKVADGGTQKCGHLWGGVCEMKLIHTPKWPCSNVRAVSSIPQPFLIRRGFQTSFHLERGPLCPLTVQHQSHLNIGFLGGKERVLSPSCWPLHCDCCALWRAMLTTSHCASYHACNHKTSSPFSDDLKLNPEREPPQEPGIDVGPHCAVSV